MSNTPKCQICETTERVLSVNVLLRFSGYREQSGALHICEGCLLGGPMMARAGTTGVRGANRAAEYIAEAAVEAYSKLRGIA